jgi:D-alanyl-lipoteichoic acid acyltransferase DltB (MBOAT superfamily)
VQVALSLAFYAFGSPSFILLLIASIAVNWLAAMAYGRVKWRTLLTLVIALDIGVLALFKYANFILANLGIVLGTTLPALEIGLPLGISFFTFHHIMYLTDLRAGRAPRYDLVRYALYIGFFPQVLAGPLVRWSEIMHQLDERPYERSDAAERFARGLMLLVVGLAKKVFIGDQLAEYVNPIFQAAAAGKALTLSEAWQGTLGFTFQIYFDFSGYTDMAVGIALLFGIVLPENFDAPYRAYSIQDFWRRWHITLSRFLRDYLYIPMGGNRYGLPRQLPALLATMTLGGLWHGAGLTFVAWGAAHGLALGADLLWRKGGLSLPTLVGTVSTFAFVALAWVLFRAPSFGTALAIYQALFGFAPLGTSAPGFWPTVALAAALATIGPTAREIAERIAPARWLGVAAALLFALLLLEVGDDRTADFIYAQF